MDVLERIQECDNLRLKEKVNEALKDIEKAFSLYSVDEIAISFNGGKDSTVLLHLIRAAIFKFQSNKNGFNSASNTSSNSNNSLNCSSNPNDSLNDAPNSNDSSNDSPNSNGSTGERKLNSLNAIYFYDPDTFSEIHSFTIETSRIYSLDLKIFDKDFKKGLQKLLSEKTVKAIFLGTRLSDPNAVGQEKFCRSSHGWPPFMRINPIMDWTYTDIWDFLRTSKVPYCVLYDMGYTSIGSIHTTKPNEFLKKKNETNENSAQNKDGNSPISIPPVVEFLPAYFLTDGNLERSGRELSKNVVKA